MKGAPKILFTHGYFIAEDEKEQKIMRPYPPLGILYLSAWLEKHGYENSVHDTTFSKLEASFNKIKDDAPDVIALYTNLMTKLNVIKLVKRIKESLPKSLIIIGGPDVTYNIEAYLGIGADVVVIGEGEQTMLELVQAVEQGQDSNFAQVDGVAFLLDDGSVFKTKARARIRPVDDLPFPNRGKIDMHAYLKTWKEHHGMSAMTVSTQRGCPYTCKWCSTAVYGQSYRRRSAALVAAELKDIKDKYNPDSIWFVDDVFSVSHKWLTEFKDEVKKQDAMIPFECITRADRMNEDVIADLKEAGCFRVWIGAESGSQKIIDLMDRRVEVNQVRQMIQLSRSAGIETGTFIMLGYPGEEQSDIAETIHHLKTSNPDHFTITIAYPIKGTSLYNEVEALQLEELDWTQTTDRDRDFKRTHPRKYYEYAVKWVVNEVHHYQKSSTKPLAAIKHKLKSIAARTAMSIYR